MAFKHLACLVQVILDAAQVAAVLLSLDLVFFVPDWAATGLSAVLVTQYNTWQWMAVDCLVPAGSAVSSAVMEAVMIIFMPVIYIVMLVPILASLKRRVDRHFIPSSSSSSSTAHYAAAQYQQQLQLGKKTAAVAPGVAVSSPTDVTSAAPSSVIAAVHSRDINTSQQAHLLPPPPPPSDRSGVEPIEMSPFAVAAAADMYGQKQHAAAPHGAADSSNSSGGDQAAGHGAINNDIIADESSCCITFNTSTSSSVQPQQQQSGMMMSSGSISLPGVINSLCSGDTGHSSIIKAHNRLTSHLVALLDGCWPLLASVVTATMSYMFALYVHMLVSSFSCMSLAGPPSLPGEIHLTGRFWVADMQQQCWRGSHLAVVLLVLVVAVPLLLGYWFLLLLLAWPQDEQQEYEEDSELGATAAAAAAVRAVSLAPGDASLPAVSSAQHALPAAKSANAPTAAAAAGHGFAFPPPKLIVPSDSTQLPDHIDMDHGPFAAAAAASNSRAAASSSSDRSDSSTPTAGGSDKVKLHTSTCEAVEGGRSVSGRSIDGRKSCSSDASSEVAATAHDYSGKDRLTPTPSRLSTDLQSPFGLVSSPSVITTQQHGGQHSEQPSPAAAAAAGAIWQVHSHSSTGSGGHHYQQQQHPELVESASGQMLLQTQFGLVPAGSGLVETPLGLKHTRSGRWYYSPGGGLTSPNRSGPPAELIPGPALQGHGLTSRLSAPVASLPFTGPGRIMETRSGPVIVPPQTAAAAAAAAAGVPTAIPMAVQAALPVAPAGAAATSSSSSSSSGSSQSDHCDQARESGLLGLINYWLRTLFSWVVKLPARVLQPPVRYCQQRYTLPVGVTGESCAGLGVWNDRCWYWMPVREIIKFVLVAAAAATTLRGPQVQALVLLLLVIVAAAVSWRVQAGCSTSMNRMQYIAYCWLQLLCLLVLLMTLQGMSAAAYGGVMLGLLVVVVGQCWLLLGSLTARCVVTGRQLGELGLDTLQQQQQYVGEGQPIQHHKM